MGDPLCAPALVGASVSALFTEVIAAAKCAFKYKGECNALLKRVIKLQSDIDGDVQSSVNCNDANSRRLEEMKSLLVGARRCAENGVNESRSESWKRVMKFWHWKKATKKLMDFTQRLEQEQSDGGYVAIHQIHGDTREICQILQENITYQKEKDLLPFVMQQVPFVKVGVDVPFKKLKESILANHTKSEPQALGLYGRGGAGKTLLAQMLHNDEDVKEKYGGGSILWITVGLDAKVLEIYKKMGLFLGRGTFEKNWSNSCLEEQHTYLCSMFAKRQVFLVLDDVWDNLVQEQPMMHWLNLATAPGSTTLITTRDTSVLPHFHVESRVVLGLSDDDSWTLFCAHAFHDGIIPSIVSKERAKEVCRECKGLPLALKVIGSAMAGKASEEAWKFALLYLKQSQPILGSTVDGELYGRLQLSYNMLENDELKTCFLYLSAFPEDYEIQTSNLLDMWIAEELFGSLDIGDVKNVAEMHLEILHKRSLIDWNRDGGYVQVHDILRDLALYIIARSKPDDCANACFFHPGKVFPQITSLQGIKRLSFMGSNIEQWPEEVEASNLQVCMLLEMDIPISSKLECFISNMMSLKYLSLSRSQFNLKDNPIDFRRIILLMYLDLSYCNSLKELPKTISELKCLTHLNLMECSSLTELPETIGELKSLTHLNLGGCSSLMELSGTIGKLKGLTELYLRGCSSLTELPGTMGEFKCLTHLNLRKCSSLRKLPWTIGELKSLIDLNLEYCASLMELPRTIGELKSLTHLNLQKCSSLIELPGTIGEFKSLTHLDLGWCSSLTELPETISELKSLTHLDLIWCSSLTELPGTIGEFKSLTHLDLGWCSSLTELPGTIGELKSLTHLDLGWCSSLTELPGTIRELKSLTNLYLQGCSSLMELPRTIGELKSLTNLILQECSSLIELPGTISELKSLTHLDLGGFSSWTELPETIGELKSLTHLDLGGCSSLTELPGTIGELKSLIDLNLGGCLSLTELPGTIGELKSLIDLNLGGCSSLTELPRTIGELKYLINLKLGRCSSLTELPGTIGELKSLTNLDLGECSSLTELPRTIGKLKSLTFLNLSRCSSLMELPGTISELKSLAMLYLTGCSSLTELPGTIGELKSLTYLDLGGCSSLTELPGTIGELKSLFHLNLGGCSSLTELPGTINKLKCRIISYL